jgi:hypothetical protein
MEFFRSGRTVLCVHGVCRWLYKSYFHIEVRAPPRMSIKTGEM